MCWSLTPPLRNSNQVCNLSSGRNGTTSAIGLQNVLTAPWPAVLTSTFLSSLLVQMKLLPQSDHNVLAGRLVVKKRLSAFEQLDASIDLISSTALEVIQENMIAHLLPGQHGCNWPSTKDIQTHVCNWRAYLEAFGRWVSHVLFLKLLSFPHVTQLWSTEFMSVLAPKTHSPAALQFPLSCGDPDAWFVHDGGVSVGGLWPKLWDSFHQFPS